MTGGRLKRDWQTRGRRGPAAHGNLGIICASARPLYGRLDVLRIARVFGEIVRPESDMRISWPECRHLRPASQEGGRVKTHGRKTQEGTVLVQDLLQPTSPAVGSAGRWQMADGPWTMGHGEMHAE